MSEQHMNSQTHASARFAGRTALVIGAGRGIGRAIAEQLQAEGATVYGTSRDAQSATEIAERHGTAPVQIDLRDTASILAGVDAVIAHAGRIDLLVNNGGVNAPARALDVTEDDWNLVHETNVRGIFFASQAVAKHWIAEDRPGSIVSITSQAGVVAVEERAAYASSKAAVIHLTKVLALEWAAAGIRVNSVAPTFVRTELTASTLARPEWAAELLRRIPLGRYGEPEEVANAACYLLSDGASLITGHTLVTDGGYTIR